ncbi:MAG TPA: DUF4301 family protein, partial [Thermoanaerobaculia bacterium]|nr:DUF4301 family protein [Thermoanaerobaculia bacterium]
PFARVLRPCRPDDGIRRIAEGEIPELVERAEDAAARGRIAKFVPASGAASRMFQTLSADLADSAPPADPPPDVARFLAEIDGFPFVEDLRAALAARGLDLDRLRAEGRRREILAALLEKPGLDYADLPKGLIPFHRGAEGGRGRTPFEEHLREAADLVRDDKGLCRLHFTVAANFLERFRALLAEIGPRLEAELDCRFEVGFSVQHPQTDTLAIDAEGRPFRSADGSLLLRPGGHGALLGNLAGLGEQGFDLVLIKNVDNVLPGGGPAEVKRWKKVLAGLLVDLEERAANLRRALERTEPQADLLAAARRFLRAELSLDLPSNAGREQLVAALDRPIRVCGVVKNQGEPGGGPFWIDSADGPPSLQLVEASQLDPASRDDLLAQATHFNPVDLACALRLGGRRHDLPRFVDPGAAFVAPKSSAGSDLLALEHPGLWNGAMAGWNTVFVEVPDATFAPVKTVLDLLRPEHQG